MLSTVTIISIFIEIFAAGILIAGAWSLIKKYFSQRQANALYAGLFFLSFFFYIGATIASQMMFNLGRDLSELILVQKAVSISLILCGLFLWGFIFEKAQAFFMRGTFILFGAAAVFFIYQIFISSVNLIYREGILEPVV
ncbi:MAG: hypothetical protein QME05_06730, partial [Candidatus Margulisbacteria bacterium]|nr:hypothetical protein [Candidatus Margulisiibacteriota bacterium]